MIEIKIVLLLACIHFAGDFLFQTDWMATNKSKKNKALGLHVLVYSAPLLFFGWKYAAINCALHFATDYATSRATSNLWARGDRRNFFVVIGGDQMIHTFCLILTYWGLR